MRLPAIRCEQALPVAHVTVPLSMISGRGRSRNPVLADLPRADACQPGEHWLAALLGNPVVRPVTRFVYDARVVRRREALLRREPHGVGLRRRGRRHRNVESVHRRISWTFRLTVRPARCHGRSDQHRDTDPRGPDRVAPASAAVAQDQRVPRSRPKPRRNNGRRPTRLPTSMPCAKSPRAFRSYRLPWIPKLPQTPSSMTAAGNNMRCMCNWC
jgi:hypothetical protein